jgi:hypothetical protein
MRDTHDYALRPFFIHLTFALIVLFCRVPAWAGPTAPTDMRTVESSTGSLPFPCAGTGNNETSKFCSAARYPYPSGGVVIGQGWDSFREEGTGASCVDVDAVALEKSTYRTDVEHLKSTYSLVTQTTTSVSAAYKGGVANVSGSLNSSHSMQINSDDQNFLFTFESSNGSTFAVAPNTTVSKNLELSPSALKLLEAAKDESVQQAVLSAVLNRSNGFAGHFIRLTPEARKLIAPGPKSEDAFRRVCGDGFVAAIHRGSRIQVLLTQKFRSLKQRDSLDATLNASGYGASGSATYSTSTDRLKTSDDLRYHVFQEGGVPFSPRALSSAKTGEFFDINGILPPPEQLLANPTAFQITVVPYSNIDPTVTSSIPSPTRLFSLGDYYIVLNDIYNLVGNILDSLRSGANSATAGPFDTRLIDAYAGGKEHGGATELEKVHDSILVDLAFLETAISNCYKDNRDCSVQEAIGTTTSSLPQNIDIQAQLSDFAIFGGQNDEFKRRLELFKEKAEWLRRLVDQHGKLDDEFFLSFYVYLTQIPLPRAAYSDNPDWKTLQTMSIPSGANLDTKKGLAQKFKKELTEAILDFRMNPWKSFFCNELKQSPLCVSDGALRALAESADWGVETFTVKYPDPPRRARLCGGPLKPLHICM